MKKYVMAMLAMLLVAVSCSTSTEPASVGQNQPELSDEVAQESADALIGRLGSNDAATDALIIAMDRGYSGDQILDAVTAGTLQGNGTIDGQDPASTSLGLVSYSETGEDEEATGLMDVGEVQLASMIQLEEVPIERLRRVANDGIEAGVGSVGAAVILTLLKRGFAPSDIVEMLIFGVDDTIASSGNANSSTKGCYRVTDEFYCPNGRRVAADEIESEVDDNEPVVTIDDIDNDEVDTLATVVPEATGPVSFTGSATQGAIETGASGGNDFIGVDFVATIEGDTVTMDAAVVVHFWVRGGPDKNYPDQNCGVMYEYGLLFEGPAGNPTSLRSTVVSSDVIDIHGALCDENSGDFWNLDVGELSGSFSGQANGLGVDGTFKVAFSSVRASNS